MWHSTELDKKELRYHYNFPVIGDPMKRIIEAYRIGSRKIHYKVINELDPDNL